MPSSQALPLAVVEALRAELREFSPAARRRGESYYRDGRVVEAHFEGEEIAAEVRGSEDYATHWFFDGHGWFSECSCPVANYCKHAYAVALQMLDGDDSAPAPALRATGKRERRGKRDPSEAALEQLQGASRVWEREHALNQLMARAPVNLSAYLYPFPELLNESDPEILAWRLAREISSRASGWLPPALEPYRDRPEFDALVAERTREALMRDLRAWVRRKRAAPSRSLRLTLRLAADDAGRYRATASALLTSPRLADAPRSLQQLGQLRTEVANGIVALPAEQMRLLEWLAEGTSGYQEHQIPTRQLRALFSLLPDSPLITWADDLAPEDAGRAGAAAGATIRFRVDGVRLLPVPVDRDGAAVLELRFLWPDGRQKALDEVVYLRGDSAWETHGAPSFAVCDGTFWLLAEEPPPNLFDRFAQAGFVPISGADRSATVGILAAAFSGLQPALDPYIRRHDAAPGIALDLRNDDWLQIRVFAHTGGPAWSPSAPGDTLVFEYTPAALWERVSEVRAPAPEPAAETAAVDAAGAGDPNEGEYGPMDAEPGETPSGSSVPPPTPDETAWLEEPEPERVAPAIAWLEDLRRSIAAKVTAQAPPWADRDVGWWIFINRKRLGALADAWEERPAGVGFFGTPRIRRLFAVRDAIRARVRVHKSGVDWLSVSAEWESEGRRLSDEDVAALRASSGRFVKLPSGWVRREIATEQDEAAAVLADLGIDVGAGEQKITARQLAGARPESLEALTAFGGDEATVEAVERLRAQIENFRAVPEVPLPAGLRAELRPYQARGLDFMAHAASIGTGAVLADDMGLGKTVQALAWLLHLREREGVLGPSLVVCPASVVHNWAREAERFTPALRVLLLTRGKERHAERQALHEYDLVVTNYALLRRDADEWKNVDLHAAILDEAQNIKNPDAVVTRAVRELRSRHRLALTGTPMENRALDLWSILSFVNPGYLGGRAQFSSRYDGTDARPHARALLAARLRPVLLRRTKGEVAQDLPERIEERVDCELTKGQRKLYLAELRRSRELVDDLAQDGENLDKNRITILAALTRLRQICCHPALAGGKPGLESGKFQTLFELLEPLLAEGHKVLVFSQFVRCLELLAREMRERDIPFHMLTGQTTRREKVVAAFQDDPRACAFLVSLKAGGTGLNLTAASYVVVFDPWWNPAVEAQAIDRAHRIGQTRTVIAYRLLARGTIEEKIFELQERKAALVRDVLGERGFARALTADDLRYLLTPAHDGDDDAPE